MIIHPDIAALRSSPASQRSMQSKMSAALAGWFANGAVQSVYRDLEDFARGGELAQLETLRDLMSDPSRSWEFVRDFAALFSGALQKAPLGQIPFLHRWSEGFTRLQLMQSGGATLALCTYEPMRDATEPEYARFADCERHDIVLAGEAECLAHHLVREGLHTRRITLRSGDRMACRPRTQSRQIVAVRQTLSLLQLTRTSAAPAPTCEHRLADGALMQQSSGDRRASEDVMALGVLGALDYETARGPMREYALDPVRDKDARWEAVRQLLAQDSARGFALLGELAATVDDPLAVPANALREQLVAAEPALRSLEEEAA